MAAAKKRRPKQVRALVSQRKDDLVRAAVEARTRAIAPYSGFKVGAALLTAQGVLIKGANVESASYGMTCCAERVALFKALTEGHKDFVAMAVAAALPGGPMPCGACRQLLIEYAPGARIWVADARAPQRVKSFTVRQLLPWAFAEVPRGVILSGSEKPTTSRRSGVPTTIPRDSQHC